MAEPVMEGTLMPDTDPPSFSSEFHSISISPPLFHDDFYNSSSDLNFLIDGDGDFDFTFDNVDDLYFPSESIVMPVDTTNREISGDFTSVSGLSGDCVLPTSSCCNLESPMDSDCSGTAHSLSLSSQESTNGVSDVSEATMGSSSLLESGELMVDQKFKVEEEAATKSLTKRKKESEEDIRDESRNNKYRRSEEDGAASDVRGVEEHDDKRNARLIRNRESSQLSRQRKKHYIEELEDKVKSLHSTITELNGKMSYFMAENATLRQQVGPGSGMSQLRHSSLAGMYPPLIPMPYPWMHCPAYMAKPQNSRVPLLPIPRLKPQQSVAKVKKKTKKVASFSALGLLFCLFLFGALAPIVNVSYGGISSAFNDQLRRKVLDINANCGRDFDQRLGRNISATENSVPFGKGSEPLFASLFVPRNEKLVKIDGNLIIHSVLASEKAMASETKNEGRSGVATTKGFSLALPSPDFRRTWDMSKHLYSKKRKALSSFSSDDTSKDQLKSTTANYKTQQWFREGVAGPLFSSGMCTEVFQFNVSSTSGAIIPAAPAIKQTKTDTHERKNNRRILRGRLPVSDFNITKDQNSSGKESHQETKPSPSLVVSVLVDPREDGDGVIDGMMGGTKSVSRVFVVVLVDGVKYVTYSCVLPLQEVPPLVTT